MNETAYSALKDILIKEEGNVLHAYQDHLGYWTIGVGRLIDQRKGGGISHNESMFLLKNDIDDRIVKLYQNLPWAAQLDYPRQIVLGLQGTLGFKQTLAAIKDGRYEDAAKGILNSKMGREDSPARAAREAEVMRTGIIPGFFDTGIRRV